MGRTKLICTLGPASGSRVAELVSAGMDVARVNFSHGDLESWRALARAVRDAEETAGRPIGLLADLSGPKVRLGELAGGEIVLEAGARVELDPRAAAGDDVRLPVMYDRIAADLVPGDRVLLADGAVELRVVSCGETCVTEVVHGGLVRSRAGINVPSERLSLPAVTAKDEEDLVRALDLGAEWIAQSFVRGADDVHALRARLGTARANLLAKIETRPAVEDIEAILEAADAIMVARGDLGVEFPYEQVPLIQRELIERAVDAGKPVVVATQMLESMTGSPRPTRAEVSDVANAVIEGADAVMLSAETAIGAYPVEAARAAARIAREAEGPVAEMRRRRPGDDPESEAFARAVVAVSADGAGVAAIACFTRRGLTAALLSAIRPQVPILAFSDDERTLRALALRRAVYPLRADPPADTDAMVAMVDELLRRSRLVPEGSLVLIGASSPIGYPRTNLLKIHRVGSAVEG